MCNSWLRIDTCSHLNGTSLVERVFVLNNFQPHLTKALLIFQIIVIVALSLNFANLFGYIKCKKDASKKLKSMAGNFLGQQLLKQVKTVQRLIP